MVRQKLRENQKQRKSERMHQNESTKQEHSFGMLLSARNGCYQSKYDQKIPKMPIFAVLKAYSLYILWFWSTFNEFKCQSI
jgi:hypothetical protein